MKLISCCLLAAGLAIAQSGGPTFGRAVSLGGHTSDLALDEARRVLYAANYTANRVDVISLDTGAWTRSMNVASQPSSLALSPDGRYLVVGHYANFAPPGAPRNALTVIELAPNTRQTIPLADPPYGVAFGGDGKALVVTSTQFLQFDPAAGTLLVLDTIAGVTARTLPQPPANAPTQIVGASMAASGDGGKIYGLTDSIQFAFDVATRRIISYFYTAAPPLGPRAVSVAHDGSFYLAGWAMFDLRGALAQFANPSGALNIGSHAVDSQRGLIYAQIPEAAAAGAGAQAPSGTPTGAPAPVLMVMDADNFNIRERLRLVENLSGKGALSADGATMYALSESGIAILPVGSLNQTARLAASREDLVFRASFCNRQPVSQEFTITDAGGQNSDFTLSTSQAGVTISPSSGTAPATVRVTLDPAAFQNQRGTLLAALNIRSANAVNLVKPVRLVINIQDPDQRGTAVNVPGKLVDVLADPQRNRFYVLRQDTNQVLVFDGASFEQTGVFRTGNTPTSLAITADRRFLLVGNDNSQYANVIDLEFNQATPPIRLPFGHYPRSIAVSGSAILAATRVAGPVHKIDRLDLSSRNSTELATLGVFENNIHINTVLIAPPNGSAILAAQADGNVLLYNASADTFSISRRDFTTLAGAFAASSWDQYVIGNVVFNASLTPLRVLDSAIGVSSGFVFTDSGAVRSGAPNATSAGVMQRIDLATLAGARATRIAEAPLLGELSAPFTRTLAALANRTAYVMLTASGFTVTAWNYDAATVAPRIDRIANAADPAQRLAPGALVAISGADFTPPAPANPGIPLLSTSNESCLTVNGLVTPMLSLADRLITAQLPFQAEGNVTLVLRTPGGVSDSFQLGIQPTAPSVFQVAAGGGQAPAVVRAANGQVVTLANPVRSGDMLVIYLTGLGRTDSAVEAGRPAPAEPLATVLAPVSVELGGVPLPVSFAGLSPGQIGVYQVNAGGVPHWVPKGLYQTLRIAQGGNSASVLVRVVD